MPSIDELHKRLDDINQKIEKAREKLRRSDSWNDHRHLTMGQMQARYDL